MRFRRTRFWVTLVAALFLANSVAVAARAFSSGLKVQGIVAIQALDATAGGHLKTLGHGHALCVPHCAQSYTDHEQELATNAFKVGFLPALFAPYFSVGIKPAASGIALAPQATGPPLTILFRNLRN